MASNVSLDAQLANPESEVQFTAEHLWLNRGPADPQWQAFDGEPSGLVSFTGSVSDGERDDHYVNASIVVCPAWNEDYGLTALEAFAWGRPLIVCNDGGGLTEIVTDGFNGLVVEPTPAAIAAGIARLVQDPELAQELGANGRKSLDSYTLNNALDQFEKGVKAAMRSPGLPS